MIFSLCWISRRCIRCPGHVGATDQGNIAAGVVRLTDSQDSSLSRMAMIQPDGSFVVQWVPAGTYTLAVSNASNVPSPGIREARSELEQRRDELCAVSGEPDGDGHRCERGGRDADSGDRVVIAIGGYPPPWGFLRKIFIVLDLGVDLCCKVLKTKGEASRHEMRFCLLGRDVASRLGLSFRN